MRFLLDVIGALAAFVGVLTGMWLHNLSSAIWALVAFMALCRLIASKDAI